MSSELNPDLEIGIIIENKVFLSYKPKYCSLTPKGEPLNEEQLNSLNTGVSVVYSSNISPDPIDFNGKYIGIIKR